jgi:hypothetical protein
MSNQNYNVITSESGVLIKAWTKGVPLEDGARQQLLNVASTATSLFRGDLTILLQLLANHRRDCGWQLIPILYRQIKDHYIGAALDLIRERMGSLHDGREHDRRRIQCLLDDVAKELRASSIAGLRPRFFAAPC